MTQEAGYIPIAANNFDMAIEILKRDEPHILLSDIHIDGDSIKSGIEIIRRASEICPEITCIAMTADPNIQMYEECMSAGSSGFLKKPLINAEEIRIAIYEAQEKKSLVFKPRLEPDKIPEHIASKINMGLVLDSDLIDIAKALGRAPKISTVVYGETGTGKEQFAKLIHTYRRENEKSYIPFVALNCASLDSGLIESILFGHAKGSFTGADKTTKGLLAGADGGILFLDEIHSLPMRSQQKVLRVLNDGTYTRVGEVKELYSDFQVIVASTKDLDQLVEEGKFLLDLRVRLTGVDVELPPLRERLENLEALIWLFLNKENANIEHCEFRSLVQRCEGYEFPGNIRELQKMIQTLVTMAELKEEPIKAKNLILKNRNSSLSQGCRQLVFDIDPIVDELNSIGVRPVCLKKISAMLERKAIEIALDRKDSFKEAAFALGISPSNLTFKRTKFSENSKEFS